jgi:hypothetical protein
MRSFIALGDVVGIGRIEIKGRFVHRRVYLCSERRALFIIYSLIKAAYRCQHMLTDNVTKVGVETDLRSLLVW